MAWASSPRSHGLGAPRLGTVSTPSRRPLGHASDRIGAGRGANTITNSERCLPKIVGTTVHSWCKQRTFMVQAARSPQRVA